MGMNILQLSQLRLEQCHSITLDMVMAVVSSSSFPMLQVSATNFTQPKTTFKDILN